MKTLYPEHEKLRVVKDQSQTIGEFLDFGLPRLGVVLFEKDEDMDEYFPVKRSIHQLLAEHFEIDEEKLDAEKRRMLEIERRRR